MPFKGSKTLITRGSGIGEQVSGTNTILNVLGEAVPGSGVSQIKVAEVLDEDRLAGRDLPNFPIPDVGVPIELQFYSTKRVFMEDISHAIGFRKDPRERVIEPIRGKGLLLVQQDEKHGVLVEGATLAELLRQIVESPSSLSASVQSIAEIDNQLRERLKAVRAPKDIAPMIQSYLNRDFDAFELGRRIREHNAGAAVVSENLHAPLPLLEKMNQSTVADLTNDGLLDDRKP